MSQNPAALSLGEGKINKLMLKFSIPCIMSLLVSSLYNIVDQIFIGNSEIGLEKSADAICSYIATKRI